MLVSLQVESTHWRSMRTEWSFLRIEKRSRLMVYSFFWVIPRRMNFMCRCFGTVCLFHLHRWCKHHLWRWNRQSLHHLWRWNRQNVLKHRHIKFIRRGITQKKEYKILNTAKIWNREVNWICKRFCLNDRCISEFKSLYRIVTVCAVRSCVCLLVKMSGNQISASWTSWTRLWTPKCVVDEENQGWILKCVLDNRNPVWTLTWILTTHVA